MSKLPPLPPGMYDDTEPKMMHEPSKLCYVSENLFSFIDYRKITTVQELAEHPDAQGARFESNWQGNVRILWTDGVTPNGNYAREMESYARHCANVKVWQERHRILEERKIQRKEAAERKKYEELKAKFERTGND